MIKKFSTSLEVIQFLVKKHRLIKEITLVAHPVGLNWRQKNNTLKKKKKNFIESFENTYKKIKKFNRKRFLALTSDSLKEVGKNEVWSVCSKIKYGDKVMHIPMMNFHTSKRVSIEDIKKLIRKINPNKKGFILESGRFYHYYGDFLIVESAWPSWIGNFAIPCIFVSPRYIGLRLRDGYTTLRVTTQAKYKPKIPRVIDFV